VVLAELVASLVSFPLLAVVFRQQRFPFVRLVRQSAASSPPRVKVRERQILTAFRFAFLMVVLLAALAG